LPTLKKIYTWIYIEATTYDVGDGSAEHWKQMLSNLIQKILSNENPLEVLPELNSLSQELPEAENWVQLTKDTENRLLNEPPLPKAPNEVLAIIKQGLYQQKGWKEYFPGKDDTNEGLNQNFSNAREAIKKKDIGNTLLHIMKATEVFAKSKIPNTHELQSESISNCDFKEYLLEKNQLPEFLFKLIFRLNRLRGYFQGAAHDGISKFFKENQVISLKEVIFFYQIIEYVISADVKTRKTLRRKLSEPKLNKIKLDLSARLNKKSEEISSIVGFCRIQEEFNRQQRKRSSLKPKKAYEALEGFHRELARGLQETIEWSHCNFEQSFLREINPPDNRNDGRRSFQKYTGNILAASEFLEAMIRANQQIRCL